MLPGLNNTPFRSPTQKDQHEPWRQVLRQAAVDFSGTVSVAGALSTAGSMTASGLVYGRGGGAGLGRITVSTSTPSGGADGDMWLQY